MNILHTARLRIDTFELDDAAFIVELLNTPGWKRFIGDSGVQDLDGAREYLRAKPMAMQERHGFSLWCVRRAADGAAVGMCGLVSRDTLPAPDLGFAFLPAHLRQGYAYEASTGVLDHARDVLRLPEVLAIAAPDNLPSIALLERLGFGERAEWTNPNGAVLARWRRRLVGDVRQGGDAASD